MAKLLNPREEVKKAIAARIRGGRQRFRHNQSDRSVHREGIIGELYHYPNPVSIRRLLLRQPGETASPSKITK
jgi:hypothetical protein